MEYSKYQNLVKKYYQMDSRELNFQNRVIIPFLESFLQGKYEVVDSSTIYKNWRNYKDENGDGICRDTFASEYTPDLLIVNGWKLFAKEKKNPSIIIEVKRPTALDRKHAENEIGEYVGKADHVILTDSITWEFYEKLDSKEPSEIICLSTDEKYVCKRGLTVERNIEWKNENFFKDVKKKIGGILKIEGLLL